MKQHKTNTLFFFFALVKFRNTPANLNSLNLTDLECTLPLLLNMNLPLRQTKHNDINKVWFINYDKEYQGSIKSEHDVQAPFLTLSFPLMNNFTNSNHAIIILDGYIIASTHGQDCVYYAI